MQNKILGGIFFFEKVFPDPLSKNFRQKERQSVCELIAMINLHMLCLFICFKVFEVGTRLPLEVSGGETFFKKFLPENFYAL